MQVRKATFRDRHAIKKLYTKDFPAAERAPLWVLFAMARGKSADFNLYFDQIQFIGFSFVIYSPKMAYILYLDVEESQRSKGYGSAILKQLKETYGARDITLNTEALDSQATNFEQRRKRTQFYLRNGYQMTGYQTLFRAGRFDILNTGTTFSKEEFTNVFKLMRGGFFAPKIYESSEPKEFNKE